MSDKTNKENNWLITVSLLILAFVAVAVALVYTRTVMVPFVLAIFVTTLVSPMLDYLVLSLKWPRTLAVIVSLLIVLAIAAILCLFVINSAATVIGTADKYANSFASFGTQVSESIEKKFEITLNDEVLVSELKAAIPGLVKGTFGTAMGFMSGFFFVAIFVIFMLAGRNPSVVRTGVMADIDHNVRRYIATKLTASLVTGILVWAILKVIGLELAEVFGMLAFLLNFIPSIGSMIATLLPIPIAVAQFSGSPWMIALAICGPGVVQLAIGNVIEPKIMGKGLNLHPVTILLALSFWGLLWGVVGMFLAAPITAVVRIILMQFDTLKPIGNLLAGELPGQPAQKK